MQAEKKSENGDTEGANLGRKLSKRQQEKAPERQIPHADGAVGASTSGNGPADSKFTENLK